MKPAMKPAVSAHDYNAIEMCVVKKMLMEEGVHDDFIFYKVSHFLDMKNSREHQPNLAITKAGQKKIFLLLWCSDIDVVSSHSSVKHSEIC